MHFAFFFAVNKKLLSFIRERSLALLSNIQFGRYVQFVGNVLAVFLALTHAFGKQIFNLSVDRTEIVFRPRRDCIVQFWR